MSVQEVQTALRSGLFLMLTDDLTLEGLLGAGRVFEAPPRGQSYPYLVLDAVESRPLLAELQFGAVHDLTLSVFSQNQSRDEAAQAAGRAADVLMTGPIVMTGHRLVNLTVTSIVSRRLRNGRGYRASCVLRAVTEPLN